MNPNTSIEPQQAKDFLYKNGYPTKINELAKEKFLEACKEGKLDVVSHYLALQMPLDFLQGWQKTTPLTRAVEGNHPTIIRALLAAGADPEFKDGSGDTPLHTAVNWQHQEALIAMVETGASPNVNNKGNWTPLSKAIHKKYESIINLLFLLDDLDVNIGNEDAVSPMHFAMNAHNIDWVERIMDKGYDSTCLSNHKLSYTFIMRMAADKTIALSFRKSVVKLFLAKGANLEHESIAGYTAWMLAKSCGDDAFADYLVKLGAQTKDIQYFELLTAANKGNLELVKKLIEAGIDPNALNSSRGTALMNAAFNNFYPIVDYLLQHGADPDILDNRNWSALCFCSENNACESFDLLLKYKAKTNELPKHSRALINATRFQRTEMVRALLENGAHINSRDSYKQTPVVVATSKKFIDVVEVLLEFNPDLDIPTDKGSSAISIAAYYAVVDAARLFAKAGADVNLKDNLGASPLFKVCNAYSSTKKHAKIAQILLEAGADYTEGDGIYESPRAGAVASKNQSCMDLLEAWMTTGLFERHCNMSLERFKSLENTSLPQAFIDSQNYQSLSAWVRLGDLEILQLLLDAGVDPNPDKVFMDTPLWAACKTRNEAAVRLLLQYGADPNHRSKYGLTPASLAIKEDFNIFKLLVKAGVNWENQNEWDDTPLNSAVGSQDLERVKYVFIQHPQAVLLKSPLHWCAMKAPSSYMDILKWFLEEVCLYIDSKDEHGNTPLILAAKNKHDVTVRYLVEQYADINAVNHKGESALYFACSSNKEDLVLFLLSNGANPAQEVYGISALKVAANRPVILDMLKNYLPEDVDIAALKPKPVSTLPLPDLHMALFQNDLNQIKQLISKGTDIDTVDYRGDTILMLAINRRQRPIVEFLLEAGANRSLKNKQEDTAWTYVVAVLNGGLTEQEDLDFWKNLDATLGKDDIDVNQQANMYGLRDRLNTAIIMGKFKELDEMLDKHEVNVNVMNHFATPLTRAISHRDADMVRFILQKGGHPDILSPRGNSPLYLAVQVNHHKIVDQLIKAKATINTVDQAFLYAVRYAEESIVELFLKAAVDLSVKDLQTGETAFDLAVAKKDDSLLILLNNYAS